MKKTWVIIISLAVIFIVLILYFNLNQRDFQLVNLNSSSNTNINTNIQLKNESASYFTKDEKGCFVVDLEKIEPTHFPDAKKYEWIIPFPEEADCVIQKPPLDLNVETTGYRSAKILGSNNWKIELEYK